MGGRGSSSGIAATHARAIENMNEAQLNKEIKREQSRLNSAKRTESKVLRSIDRSFSEAFPLGSGGLKKSEANRIVGKESVSSLNKSSKVAQAIKNQESAQRRLDALEKAKKAVKGTGKTLKQISQEKMKATPQTMKWTQTKEKGQFGNVTVRKSGDITIRSTGGSHFIYKNGKRVGMTSKLSDAKSLAERLKKR